MLVLMVASCKKKSTTTTTDQAALDEQTIVKYISDNKLKAKATGTGLYYVIDNAGSGIQPLSNSTVVVKYKGYFIDGTVFDQSTNAGAEFNLSQVIEGWKEGIPLFKKGGSGKLLIPSKLGYGTSAKTNIPANSVLIFDITLLNVKY